MPDPSISQAKSDRSTPRVIMVEGVPWVSHEFHERFINEMDAENERLRDALRTVATHEPRPAPMPRWQTTQSVAREALAKSPRPSDEEKATDA